MITHFVKGLIILFPLQLSQYHSNRIPLTKLALFRTFQEHIYFINRDRPLLTKHIYQMSIMCLIRWWVLGGNKRSLTCGPCPQRFLSNWRGK